VREVRMLDIYKRELERKERAVRRAEVDGHPNPLQPDEIWEIRGLLALEKSAIPLAVLI
jgi:hypothetical protein